jgi:cytochrome c biogenesis protein CcdA
MVLGLLHDKGTFTSGLWYLALYNLIFVLPLVVVLLIASDKGLLERAQTWKRENTRGMRYFGGAAMVALGLLIFLL